MPSVRVERQRTVSHHPRPTSHVYRSIRDSTASWRASYTRPLSEQGAGLREVPFAGHATDHPIGEQFANARSRNDPERQRSSIPYHDEEDEYDSDDDSFDSDLHHDDDVVDHLDVIDPQVGTVTTLTNTANAIVFPPTSFFSRRPVVALPSIDSWSDVSASSTDQLDKHVQHVLNAGRMDKLRRVLRGVWDFLKTPQGIVVGIYGFLVVFWGSAIVLFLAKWINLHNKDLQDQWVELTCQIVNTLFCITGLGLAPWRCLDTYRIYKIWKYKQRTKALRRLARLPDLFDSDDLPDPQYNPHYVHVLSDREQADLHYQQVKFAKSQTWYRPHGTETHRAFPIGLALVICSLNVGNSIFQAMLAGCMWSMDRFQRPAWTTGSLIPFAFACGIASGLYIWRGGQKTKRTERVEAMLRAAFVSHASLAQDVGVPSEGDTATASTHLNGDKGGIGHSLELEKPGPGA